jgi:hypothetical protein
MSSRPNQRPPRAAIFISTSGKLKICEPLVTLRNFVEDKFFGFFLGDDAQVYFAYGNEFMKVGLTTPPKAGLKCSFEVETAPKGFRAGFLQRARNGDGRSGRTGTRVNIERGVMRPPTRRANLTQDA